MRIERDRGISGRVTTRRYRPASSRNTSRRSFPRVTSQACSFSIGGVFCQELEQHMRKVVDMYCRRQLASATSNVDTLGTSTSESRAARSTGTSRTKGMRSATGPMARLSASRSSTRAGSSRQTAQSRSRCRNSASSQRTSVRCSRRRNTFCESWSQVYFVPARASAERRPLPSLPAWTRRGGGGVRSSSFHPRTAPTSTAPCRQRRGRVGGRS